MTRFPKLAVAFFIASSALVLAKPIQAGAVQAPPPPHCDAIYGCGGTIATFRSNRDPNASVTFSTDGVQATFSAQLEGGTYFCSGSWSPAWSLVMSAPPTTFFTIGWTPDQKCGPLNLWTQSSLP